MENFFVCLISQVPSTHWSTTGTGGEQAAPSVRKKRQGPWRICSLLPNTSNSRTQPGSWVSARHLLGKGKTGWVEEGTSLLLTISSCKWVSLSIITSPVVTASARLGWQKGGNRKERKKGELLVQQRIWVTWTSVQNCYKVVPWGP